MKIQLLQKDLHERGSFFCGVEALDDYLKKYALQDSKRNLTKVFVLEGSTSQEVAGYYTLSPLSFSKDELGIAFSKKLPHYPIPAILLGKLAVDVAYQKQGIGTLLLMDALLRVYQASQESFGIYAVIVDAKNNKAKTFYENFGFIPFLNENSRLFLSLETVKMLIVNVQKDNPLDHKIAVC